MLKKKSNQPQKINKATELGRQALLLYSSFKVMILLYHCTDTGFLVTCMACMLQTKAACAACRSQVTFHRMEKGNKPTLLSKQPTASADHELSVWHAGISCIILQQQTPQPKYISPYDVKTRWCLCLYCTGGTTACCT